MARGQDLVEQTLEGTCVINVVNISHTRQNTQSSIHPSVYTFGASLSPSLCGLWIHSWPTLIAGNHRLWDWLADWLSVVSTVPQLVVLLLNLKSHTCLRFIDVFCIFNSILDTNKIHFICGCSGPAASAVAFCRIFGVSSNICAIISLPTVFSLRCTVFLCELCEIRFSQV